MKSLRIVFIALTVIMSSQAIGQKKFVTTEFWVGGTCNHCKERIENTVDVKGVKMAQYDLSNHMLEITYKPAKVDIDRLHQMLADIGHDTKKVKASDEVYNNINDCCKYRDHKHDHGHDHEDGEEHEHDEDHDHEDDDK